MRSYDVIVVGLGTAGSAACMTLARRGVSVLGVDMFRPPHTMGSHHGRSRSVRRAYLEGSVYLPMARRAWDLWRRLETDSGERLLVTTGNLTIGPPDGPALTGFLASARTGGIPHECLSAAQIRKRWPPLAPSDDLAGGLEKEAGIVFPETCIRVFLRMAEASGATLHTDERVAGWTIEGEAIKVHTSLGSYSAGRVLIAAGARSGRLLGDTGAMLSPKRVPVHWIEPPDAAGYALGTFPVNFWQVPTEGTDDPHAPHREFYALPAIGPGGRVKAAFHNGLADGDPHHPAPPASAGEVAAIRRTLARFLPPLSGQPITSDTCMYTLTPDHHFLMGAIPGNDNVFAVALAGHGFKFAPVLGEILADLVQGRSPAVDVSFFSPRRPGKPSFDNRQTTAQGTQ
ncbi:N-methyltryptophan oxidase [Desulfosarcina alkanivorans]|uniref:N-methyltryptophan oxidase n=1 Tax=Desulfosarcina alkanivorans TaxID=571177 RepID=A0A5K7YNJ4_9BACT|nr:N-methyl-L-tryptophan oxidase [Desulfosarcina alkanivorans]BBO70378.1 N-methyltryptophan oxidase [Desulfosarcina alkanivorans]